MRCRGSSYGRFIPGYPEEPRRGKHYLWLTGGIPGDGRKHEKAGMLVM